jgi:acyl-coenzyme A thioesterase PaaI-like protein
MSSPAPRLEPFDDPDFAARVRAASALRRFGHSFVGHHVDRALFDEVADTVEGWIERFDAQPVRYRPIDDMKRGIYGTRPEDGETMDHFPDCVVSGKANPMGIAIEVHRDGEDAVVRVTLGEAFEGAPSRAHGGVVAAVFDDAMGFVLGMLSAPAFTGELTIRYLAPTPVGDEIEFRARLRERVGRKLYIEAEATDDGETIATAEGLFICIPRERLGLSAEG